MPPHDHHNDPPHDHHNDPPHDHHNDPPHDHHDDPPHDHHDDPPHDQPVHPDDQDGHANEGDDRRSIADADGYLFAVAYDDDAERKRAEYLFNTWEGGEIRKPEGIIRIAEDVEHEELYQELLVKFRSEQVDAYALSSLEIPQTPEKRTIERALAADSETVRSFLQYLISRKKGSETGPGEYELYTNKGRADVFLSLTSDDGQTIVTVEIEGHPPVLDQLTTYLRAELDEFQESR